MRSAHIPLEKIGYAFLGQNLLNRQGRKDREGLKIQARQA
jgi:hypothetical protein